MRTPRSRQDCSWLKVGKCGGWHCYGTSEDPARPGKGYSSRGKGVNKATEPRKQAVSVCTGSKPTDETGLASVLDSRKGQGGRMLAGPSSGVGEEALTTG